MYRTNYLIDIMYLYLVDIQGFKLLCAKHCYEDSKIIYLSDKIGSPTYTKSMLKLRDLDDSPRYRDMLHCCTLLRTGYRPVT